MTKAKKARLDIKTEIIDNVVDDECHDEISYIDTTDEDKQMCVTGEEREVLEREGTICCIDCFFEDKLNEEYRVKILVPLISDMFFSFNFVLRLLSTKMCHILNNLFRMGVNREKPEKGPTQDQEQDFCSRIAKTKTRLC